MSLLGPLHTTYLMFFLSLSSFRSSAFTPAPISSSKFFPLKNSLYRYIGADTKPNPFTIIAFTTCPKLIFSSTCLPNFSFIVSTNPISSTIPATIPRWFTSYDSIPFASAWLRFHSLFYYSFFL